MATIYLECVLKWHVTPVNTVNNTEYGRKVKKIEKTKPFLCYEEVFSLQLYMTRGWITN